MSTRIRPLLAVAASLTLCLLALTNPVAAQNIHPGHMGGGAHAPSGAAHAVTRLRGDSPRRMVGSANGLRVPSRGPSATQRAAASGYGLHASGPLALTPTLQEGPHRLTASQLNGSALNPEPVRAGSLRADITRYNAERTGHTVSTQGRMEVPHPPSSYSSNLYTN